MSIEVFDRSDAELGLIVDESSLDPEMYYRFVHDSPMNIAKKKQRGFRVVSRKEDGIDMLMDVPANADDTIRFNDLILMCASRAVVERRRRAKAQLTTDRLENNAINFHTKVEDAARRGLKVSIKDRETDRNEPEDE